MSYFVSDFVSDFPIPKDIIHLTYRVMSSLNTLDFVSDFVSHFVSHFVSEPISKRNFIKKTFPNRFKAAEWPDSRIVSLQYEIDIERNITKNSVKLKNKKKHGKISSLFIGEKT